MNPNWRHSGSEPDYRFTLANERTYLAWIRTGLGVLAAAVVLDGTGASNTPRWIAFLAPLGLCAVAAVLLTTAYVRWRRAQRAMRLAEPLPPSRGLEVVTLVLLVLVGFAAAGILIW